MNKKYSSLENIFFNSPGQMDLAALFFFVGIIIFSLIIAVNIQKFSPLMVLAVVAGLVVAVLTLVNTNFALIILIFSMLWSPEIPIAGTPERAVTIRIDDFMIMAVFFTWLAKMAITRQSGFVRHTPLNKPLLAYLGAHLFSTVLGMMAGNVVVKSSIFYILKYVEYVMIYFLFVNNLNNMKQLKVFIFYFLLTAFTIGIFTYAQMGSADRPTAPFEGEHGEPNTLGGYLMFTMAIAAGIFLYSSPFSLKKLLLGGLFCFNILPLLMTLSRSSYLGMAAVMVFLAFATKKGKMFLVSIMTISILVLPLVAPEAVKKRVVETFVSKKTLEVVGEKIELEESAYARVESLRYVMKILPKKLFFGYGILGTSFIDPQFLRFLAEIGVVGFFVVLWLLMSLIVNCWKVFSRSEDDFSKGLALGVLAGFIGLLVVGNGASVFVIVRISEPLWFAAACVISLLGMENIDEQPEENSRINSY